MESKLSENILHIKKYLSRQKRSIYTAEDMGDLIGILQQKNWIGVRTTIKDLIAATDVFHLFSEQMLCDVEGQLKSTRYTLGPVDDLQFLASLAPSAYFSHASALYFNGITENIGPHIYLTTEQTAQNYATPLTQKAIDHAFLKPPRLSHHQTRWKDYTITFLHRKLPARAPGSPDRHHHAAEQYTDLERTLLDIVVIPEYAGSCSAVLQAFKKSKGNVDVVRLFNYLQKMDFAYPYHQSIGFYLEMAGYPLKDYKPFLPQKGDLKFYLQKQMQQPRYNERWKMYYPADL